MPDTANDNQFSGRLYARLYFVLVLSIIVIGSGLVYVVRQMDESDDVAYVKSIYQPFMSLVAEQLSQEKEADWPARLADISHLSQRQINLMSLQDFAADEDTMDELAGGELLVLFDSEDVITLYQQVVQSPQVLAVEIPASTIMVGEHVWVAPLFYLLIAAVVYVLIRPFVQHLLQLKDAAMQFGRGEFSTRLELPPSTTLAPIADAFNGMAQKIERLLLTQRDLVNSVSHELRTPLARLKFGFEELESVADHVAVQRNIVAMKQDVSELEALIDEMLRYAEVNQIEAFNRRPLPLGVLIDRLMDDVAGQGQSISVVFEPSINRDESIMCHEHSLHRAIANVLRNALSFAEEHCELRVKCLNSEVLIEISDDGPGLDQINGDRIFEPFYKVSSHQRKAGYGLGLAIAQSIAKKHQGSLSVAPGSLKGACFRFSLPAS